MAPSERWLRVARIVRPQGHKGEVLAELLTDFPERFQGQPTLWLRAAESEAPARTVRVEHARLHAGRIALLLAGCDSMDKAEALRGTELLVPWEERVALPNGEIYAAELAGSTLINTSVEGEAVVGTLVDVDRESGAGTLLVVELPGGGELLVPFVLGYAPHWDAEARTLRMALPEGLLTLDGVSDGDGE